MRMGTRFCIWMSLRGATAAGNRTGPRPCAKETDEGWSAMKAGASSGSIRSVTSRSDFIRVSPGKRVDRNATTFSFCDRSSIDVGNRVDLQQLACGAESRAAKIRSHRTRLGNAAVVDLVHRLPVLCRVNECNLDLEQIHHRRARPLEQGLHDVQRIGRLLLDVTGAA